MTEKEKMLAHQMYDANYNKELHDERIAAKELCWEYNQLRPSNEEGQRAVLKKLLGKTGENFYITAPFWCDYGYNIELGENFYANHNLVILDCAKVKFGDNVFVAPDCGFHTAGHPIDFERRNAGFEAEIAKAVRFYEITIEHLTGKQIHRKCNETQPAQKRCAGGCSLCRRCAILVKKRGGDSFMKKIYLMRHGETLFNTMDVNQGQCDSPLTENGIRQAKAAKAWFDAHNVHFDAVYSSTSERACDTAEFVSGGMSYTRRKDLKEIFLGIKEASPIRENPTYPYGDYFVKYGGEDLDAFTERVYGAVKGIAEHAAGECILIVSHGMAIRRFLTKFPEKAGEITGFIGNCGILEMTYADGKLTVEKIINPNG